LARTSKPSELPEPDVTNEAELWPAAGDSTRRLLLAAVAAFAQRGYHGTTTRHIADRAQMSAAAIYTHYRSKAELLFEISWAGHAGLLAEMRAVFARPGAPVQRLRNLVRAHVRYHARLHTLARVANYDLQSLDPGHRRAIVELRDEMEAIMREAIRLGIESGAFEVADLDLATISLLSLGIDVSRWFVPGKRLTPEELAEEYADMAVRILTGSRVAAAGGITAVGAPARD
jgi:AcrR family transcriptional regulator